jgi:DNA invertase Pin-like site-specific DNA recombinase
MSETRKLRCAIYTRKSSEEGLDQAFNSLDAQREACAAYIASQATLGWRLVAEHYDDGGISGGTLERPAIQRLLQHIEDRKVDIVVVYKIDRLTRSLADFARLVEVFDRRGVSFVSVTQQFNTTTSMGRLTLNVLLSFAQFEREVTAERIRDKIAASKKKGMWMGGRVPLGYRLIDRKLVVDGERADYVRSLFDGYLALGSVSALMREIERAKSSRRDIDRKDDVVERDEIQEAPLRTPQSAGHLRHLLSNPVYIGKLRHRDQLHDGEHEAIVDPPIFERVQLLLERKVPEGRKRCIDPDFHLLTGLLFDETGDRLAPNHAKSRGRRYRYYISSRLRNPQQDNGPQSKRGEGWRIPASELEGLVIEQAIKILTDPSLIAEWIEETAASPSGIVRAIEAAARLARSLEDSAGFADRKEILHKIFASVTLVPASIRFAVRQSAVVACLANGSIDPPQTSDSSPSSHENRRTFIIERPMTIRRRGVEVRIVIEGRARSNPDPALVDLIAKAHLYLERLTDGSAASIAALADQLDVHRADISRILPLAFLSPAITEAILNGRQPADLTARSLSRLIDIPAAWDQQAEALGI